MYSTVEYKWLGRLLNVKTAAYKEKTDTYEPGMRRVSPSRRIGGKTTPTAAGNRRPVMTQPVKVPADRRTDLSPDAVIEKTQLAEKSRRNTQQAGRAAENAQLEYDRPIGVGEAYQAAQRQRDQENEARARKEFVDRWQGDYKRPVDDIYNEMASDRYTDSRWQATKNWFRRAFGSTDHDAQKTYKDWRGYTTEGADNSWFTARDKDLDRLRSEAHRRRGEDRANLAREYSAEKQQYDNTVGASDLIKQIPSEQNRYGFDGNGNVYKGVLERGGAGGVTEGDFNSAAEAWAEKLMRTAGLDDGAPIFERARNRLVNYVNAHRYDNSTDGKTLSQILLDAGMSRDEVRAIMNATNLTGRSDYAKSRIWNDKR